MNDSSYVKIDVNCIYENIKYIKKEYPFLYYIMDVSNEAFSHGMYLTLYLEDQIDYLYVHNLEDVIQIRKYHASIPIIYNGVITSDNVFDLIINNATLVIHDADTLKMIKELDIKDDLNFLFYVDPAGFTGISKKQDILDFLEWNMKHLHLVGVMAQIEEKDYDDFKYIIRPIADSPLMILNYEKDKRKIQGSNAILLDESIYGINPVVKKLFAKNDKKMRQAFTLYTKISKVQIETTKNKCKYIAVVPFGYVQGMSKKIEKVFIQNKLYEVLRITSEYTYILVDEHITKDMEVEITSVRNPLEDYIPEQTLSYFRLLTQASPIIYDDYIFTY